MPLKYQVTVPLNYQISLFVLGSLCVGDLVWLGLSSVHVAGFSLQHGHYDQFGNSTAQSQAPDDGYINV